MTEFHISKTALSKKTVIQTDPDVKVVLSKSPKKQFKSTTERSLASIESDDFAIKNANLGKAKLFEAKKNTFDTVNGDYQSANVVSGGRKKWAPLSTRHKSFTNRRSIQQLKSKVTEGEIKMQEEETQRSISQVKELLQPANKFMQSSPQLLDIDPEVYL